MALDIIAEIHPQHGGSMDVIREMIRESKLNGANAIKLQLYDAKSLLGNAWEYVELSDQDTIRIKQWCDDEEIEFLASVFDEHHLDLCEKIGVSRYKIASVTVKNNPYLCEQIIRIGKETIISLGQWEKESKPFNGDNIKYLFCVSKYPAHIEDMISLPSDFKSFDYDGYSDHTLGIEMCLLAISRGAQIIEKHMTLDKMRTKSTERAHICSMTPLELKLLSNLGGSIHRTLSALKNYAKSSS